MKFFNKLSCAFSAGCMGAIALLIVLILWRGMPHSLISFKADIYRLMVWGGIWALLMVLPMWKTHWFIRGSVLGIIVILL